MEIINGHKVRLMDFRPIGLKNTPTCVKCGISGLRKLKKQKCK